MKRFALFTMVMILFSTFHCFGQEKIPRKLFIQELTGAEIAEKETRVFNEYLAVVIAEEVDIVLEENREEANCVLTAAVIPVEDGGYSIAVRAGDLLSETTPFSYQETIPAFEITALYETIFPAIIDEVKGAFPPLDQEVVEVVTERVVEDVQVKQVKGLAATLTIEGDPGTVITVKGGEKYTIDESGRLEIEFPYNVSVQFTARNPDYYIEKKKLVIEEEDLTYRLKQERPGYWGIDGRIRMYEFALVPGGMFFFYPGFGYINLYIENNFLSLAAFERGVESLFFVSPVLGAGWYFLPPGSLFRIAASAGVYTRIVFPSDEPIYFSRLNTFGFQLGILGELSPFKRVRFYVEYTPRIFYASMGEGVDLLVNREGAPAVIPIAGSWYFQPGLLLTLGMRVLF